MKEINEDIELTLNLMRYDENIDDGGAYSELQSHLYSLLEMKRNELQRHLVECKLGYVACDKPKPLSTEELKAGGWWCKDVSNDCAKAFESKGLRVINSFDWGSGVGLLGCRLDDDGDVTREFFGYGEKKQIYRLGDDFYWSEK